MKFKYLIVDENGNVSGTDSEKVALAAVNDPLVVIDLQAGAEVILDSSGARAEVTEQTDYKL